MNPFYSHLILILILIDAFYLFFSSLSKLLPKSKSQSLFPATSNQLTISQANRNTSDGVTNDAINADDENNSAAVDGNALPSFLKGGIRRSVTQVRIQPFVYILFPSLQK